MGGSWQNDRETVSESATEQVLITESLSLWGRFLELGMTKKKSYTYTYSQAIICELQLKGERRDQTLA